MKLTVFNGSPRGKKSNTRILMEQFLSGFGRTPGNGFEVHYLSRVADQEAYREAFAAAEVVLLAFPLYTDAMPGIVKEFIETLCPLCGRAGNPALGFVVQSGFPEAAHSRAVERYNEKLSRRLGCRYLGTVVRGGAEGIQVMPPSMTRRLFASFDAVGETFGRTGELDAGLVRRLAGSERLSLPMRLLYRLLRLTGLTNFYWNGQLKANGAFERRFAAPYA
jgi:NAD(P)H-dependent FMN reductase